HQVAFFLQRRSVVLHELGERRRGAKQVITLPAARVVRRNELRGGINWEPELCLRRRGGVGHRGLRGRRRRRYRRLGWRRLRWLCDRLTGSRKGLRSLALRHGSEAQRDREQTTGDPVERHDPFIMRDVPSPSPRKHGSVARLTTGPPFALSPSE